MKSTPKSSTQEVLAGLVERVTFHNAENGFCVLRAKARGHRDLVRAATRSLMSASRALTSTLIDDRLAGGGARLEVESCAHAGKHKGVAPVSLASFPVAWAKRLA